MPDFPAAYAVPVALSERSHETVGGRRADEAWLEEAWADPSTRVLVLAGGRFPTTHDGAEVRWVAPAEAPVGQRLLLGERDGVVHFAVVVDGRVPDDWGMLRTVGSRLEAADAGLVVEAQALAEWHRAHRFCSWCGGGLLPAAGGHQLRCEGCRRQHFPRTDPAVIMLVTDGDRALLGRQAVWPEGRYSTLAGFVDPGESLEHAVRREVMEEAGIAVGAVSYFGNQPWPFPASLMVAFFAEALTTEVRVDGDELEDARWWTRAELREEAEAGRLLLPGGISISRSLVEAWYGAPLPGSW